MDKAMELATSWGLKLQGVLEQYGPKVADLALTLGRMEAAKTLLIGFVWGIIALIAGIVGYKLFNGGLAHHKAYKATDWHRRSETYDGFAHFLFGVLLCIGSFGTSITSLITLTNIYAWVGLFRPEIYLAAKALGWT